MLAGLLGKDNWKKWPSDMMFARALTRGARRYCPDVFGGPAYTKEELEDSVDISVDNNDDLSKISYDTFVEKIKLEVNPTVTKDVITNFLKDGGYSWKTSSKRDMFNYIAEKLKVEQPVTDGEFEASED
ncbi:MAG: recombinase RecT [Richelia sp. SL_2_1]|nr:recombinase RecT [Richelia sp. SL_2_1]